MTHSSPTRRSSDLKVLDVESVAIFGELFSQIRFPKSELVQMVFEFAISISAVVRIGDPFVDLVPEGIGKRNAVLFINRRYHSSGISDEIPETDVMQSWVEIGRETCRERVCPYV